MTKKLWDEPPEPDAPSKRAAVKTVEQTSAGGVAYRANGTTHEVAVILTTSSLRWQLPKGIVDEGETPEQAAVREVREEAGVETDLVAHLRTIQYWYYGERRGERVRYRKQVHFYLLAYRGGRIEDHDHEVAEARWATFEEAARLLAFKNEREVLEEARALIQSAGDKRA